MNLYMIRHGQSETNLARKYTGWAQVNLTEQGIEDARRAGRYLRNIPFDRVYSSDLSRAIQTAQHALPGCQPILLTDLREVGLGTLELRSVDECIAEYGQQHVEDRLNYEFTRYGGENNVMVRERVKRFFRMLEQNPCENVAAFAHAGVLQCAMEIVLDQSIDRRRMHCANGSAALFCWKNGVWSLHGWGLGL